MFHEVTGTYGNLSTTRPGKRATKNYGKSPFLMGKLTISMAIFNSYVSLPEGMRNHWKPLPTEIYCLASS